MGGLLLEEFNCGTRSCLSRQRLGQACLWLLRAGGGWLSIEARSSGAYGRCLRQATVSLRWGWECGNSLILMLGLKLELPLQLFYLSLHLSLRLLWRSACLCLDRYLSRGNAASLTATCAGDVFSVARMLLLRSAGLHTTI